MNVKAEKTIERYSRRKKRKDRNTYFFGQSIQKNRYSEILNHDTKAKWEKILLNSSVMTLPQGEKQLIDHIARIGYKHAEYKQEYSDDLIDVFSEWAWSDRHSSRDFVIDLTYNVLAGSVGKKGYLSSDQARIDLTPKEKERVDLVKQSSVSDGENSSVDMKRFIPLSYVIMGVVFLCLSFAFFFTFYSGCHGGSFLIGPWSDLMLLVGSVGMLITVIVAVIEWRQLFNGKRNKEGQ